MVPTLYTLGKFLIVARGQFGTLNNYREVTRILKEKIARIVSAGIHIPYQSVAPIRVSNEERREWKKKCHEELSTQTQSRLGIVIEPAQVDHVSKPDTPDHSTGAYKQLCNGVERAFEAIPAKQGNSADSFGMVEGAVVSTVGQTEIGFGTLIDQLQDKNFLLCQSLEEMRTQLSVELECRRHAESELARLKEVNKRLQEAYEENDSVAMRLR